MPRMVTVYRSGVPNPPAERGCEATCYAAADAACPTGRQGRTTALFASPTLEGVTRWVRGNALTGIRDYAVRALRVNPDTVWVYSVREWERASSHETRDGYAAYWDTGVTLTDWLTRHDADPAAYPAGDWELLLPPDIGATARPVSTKRLCTAAPSDYARQELARLFRGR